MDAARRTGFCVALRSAGGGVSAYRLLPPCDRLLVEAARHTGVPASADPANWVVEAVRRTRFFGNRGSGWPAIRLVRRPAIG
ncbi:hypothetical protein OHA70_24300 [Kribbella sp. NBC_00382]|uniref:hypothetical protein n=1 Tax=Kribbella sp. NBC_00382 TaxID=2975967 RepID=UPI002E1C7514